MSDLDIDEFMAYLISQMTAWCDTVHEPDSEFNWTPAAIAEELVHKLSTLDGQRTN
jgi:hypothetical protein